MGLLFVVAMLLAFLVMVAFGVRLVEWLEAKKEGRRWQRARSGGKEVEGG